jgi:hypothetical protein
MWLGGLETAGDSLDIYPINLQLPGKLKDG